MGFVFARSNAKPQLIHYFCTERARLAKDLPVLRKKMRDDAMLWVSWPKKSAGLPTTVTEDVVRECALPLGSGGYEGLRGGRDLVRSSPGGAAGEPEVDSATASCCITTTASKDPTSTMAYLNENYLKLQAGYLFPEIGRRVKEFCEANPEAAKRLDPLRDRRRDRAAAAGRGDGDEEGGG